MSDYYRESNANVHRGIHHLSQEASILYEEAHDRVADFIGASGGREEVDLHEAHDRSREPGRLPWGLNELGPGDEIVLTEMEHHASLVTWQQIGKRTGADVKYIRITDDGTLDMDHARELITDDTAMLSAVHVSNTLGTANPVSEAGGYCPRPRRAGLHRRRRPQPTRRRRGYRRRLYASPATRWPGPPVSASSTAKRAPRGDGALPLRRRHDPQGHLRGLHLGRPPRKFEPGTPPIAEAVGLVAAIDWLENSAWSASRPTRRNSPATPTTNPAAGRRGDLRPRTRPGARRPRRLQPRERPRPRSGLDHERPHGCDPRRRPLYPAAARQVGVAASARASFYVYNTRDEVDKLVAAIDDARQLFA